mgnify:CR=1 FL=1
MQLLSLINFLTLNEWLVLVIFLVFIVMLFRGIPVAYALVGVSLMFIILYIHPFIKLLGTHLIPICPSNNFYFVI